jgi:apolipoprotein N-acyltransferase
LFNKRICRVHVPFKQYLESLTGLKRYTFAFLLGAGMTLSMPPVGAFPVLLVCVPGFIFLSRGAAGRSKAFLTGWAFGAGYFICGLYWISAALFVDIHQWGWVLPFSAILGPALFAFYYGFIPLLAWRHQGNEVAYTLTIITLWSAIEWLRGHLFTGFPWNLLGYAWTQALPVMQTSAFIGIYGLTLLTLLWASIPALLPNKKIALAVGVSFIAVACLGMARLALYPTEPSAHNVRIVQANIAEGKKWSQDEDLRNLEKHTALSRTAPPGSIVIWPETSVTADLKMFPDIAQYIAMNLPSGSTAILGALRVTETADGKNNFFNSVSVLDRKAHVLATYDKHHLVPFGEYIPFRDKIKLKPIASALAGIGDFTRGDGPGTLTVAGLPSFSPLVCYEVIFPHEVVPENNRPEWIVNVTNDAWYGRTSGPYQHLDTARVRAIEEGLPLARAANTGVSAMIDPLGRIIARQTLETEGFVDSFLPKPLLPTLYAKTGDGLFLAMLVLMALWGSWVYRKINQPFLFKDNRSYLT